MAAALPRAGVRRRKPRSPSTMAAAGPV